MEKFNLNYSLKNIPVGGSKVYMTRIYDMAAKFINRMRWCAYWYTNDATNTVQDNDEDLYKFPSRNSAPHSDHLAPFEGDLYDAIRKIKFRRVSNGFQKRLNEDIQTIRKSKNLLISADKTTNIYQVPAPDYQRLIKKAINQDYKKAPVNALNKINDEAEGIIKANNIKGKIPKYEQKEAFITIKDHKAGFPSTVSTRLINPSKTHLGKVAKAILDKINCSIKSETDLIQWKNTQEVLTWFDGIHNKKRKCFIKFDIVNFYPSITSKNITDALKFARKHTKVTKEEERIIRHSCKTLMFHNNEPWIKRNSRNFFDIPMGSFYGAELCELIGLLILHKIKDVFDSGCCGLYRDDGLAIVKLQAKCNLIKIEQQVRKNLEHLGFGITIESGLLCTDFLDVSLNLKLDSYNPYKKPNSKLRYVNKNSNHPPNVTKSIPKMVVQRLCRLSKDKATFDNHSREYLDELKSSGYDTENLSFQKPKKRQRKRRRKIIYFHPPFCRSVKTNFGRVFRNLVEKHFTPYHIFYKIFNKNTLKLSYSCLPNIKAILNSHNRKIIDGEPEPEAKTCNCRRANECPLNGNCLVKNVIYKAEVATTENSSENKIYIGSTSRKFKRRFDEHKSSFNNSNKSSKLAKHIRKLKKNKTKYNIKWKVISKSAQTTPNIKFCVLCNLERIEIDRARGRNLLNTRNELVTQCPHNARLYFDAF